MTRRLLPILVANLLLAPVAAAQEGLKPPPAPEGAYRWFGNVGVGGIVTSENSQNPWKLFEYRDLDNGILSNIDLRGRGERSYVDAFAENIGRTDAYFDVRGARYNQFKYQVYGDWLQHNLSFGPDGARSPYSGIGSSTLTTVFPQLNSNVPPWNSFDFETKNRVLGGSFELSNIYVSPWYARADANQVRTKGIYPASAAAGTSPGNGFVDLPAPTDFLTTNWSVEGGYSTRQAQFAVNFLKSKFTNDNELLRWTNPFFGGNNLDTTTLPPDNDLWKLSANGALRQLPWGSTLAGRLTYAELTNSVGMLGSMLNTGPTFAATNPSSPTFNGKLRNTSATAAFTSTPIARVDTRLYYNYYEKKNESNQITFVSTPLGCPPPGCHTELFGYQKNNAGAEVAYRFNPQNRLSGLIDYTHIDRERVDYPKTSQWTYGVQWRNSSFDFLGVLLGVSYLQRRSDFALENIGANANDPLFLERYVARFDASDLDQTRIRLVLDSSPVPFLDLGFEAYWKHNDYKPNPDLAPLLGRTKDYRQEYYASVAYGDPQSFRVTLFGDIEFIKYYSYHRNIGAGVCPGTSPNCFDPNSPPTATAYNWDATNNDTNWALGVGADWKPMERLTLKGSAIWARTLGNADIVSQNNFGNPLPIASYDTTSKVTLNLKGIYQYDRNWQYTAGYAYEEYNYSDEQYNGYRYVIPAGTAPNFFGTSYLSGAYAFPNYRANIFYVVVNYKFD
jgi:Putative outer membrane beta-barrel porin, MtrB/PioB